MKRLRLVWLALTARAYHVHVGTEAIQAMQERRAWFTGGAQ